MIDIRGERASPICGRDDPRYGCLMEDIVFISLAETLIHQVDDRFGRAAAWAVAVIMCVLPIALIAGVVVWLTA